MDEDLSTSTFGHPEEKILYGYYDINDDDDRRLRRRTCPDFVRRGRLRTIRRPHASARSCLVDRSDRRGRTNGERRVSSGGAGSSGSASRSSSCHRRMRPNSPNDCENSESGSRRLPFRWNNHRSRRFEGEARAVLNMLSIVWAAEPLGRTMRAHSETYGFRGPHLMTP